MPRFKPGSFEPVLTPNDKVVIKNFEKFVKGIAQHFPQLKDKADFCAQAASQLSAAVDALDGDKGDGQ